MSKFHPHIKKTLPNAGACSTEPHLKALNDVYCKILAGAIPCHGRYVSEKF